MILLDCSPPCSLVPWGLMEEDTDGVCDVHGELYSAVVFFSIYSDKVRKTSSCEAAIAPPQGK